MSELKTNKISPATLTEVVLGDDGDTFTIPSGVTIVNSGTATGFGGGKVVQVVTNTYATETTTTSGTYVSCGFSASITPSATSSKILCLVHIAGAFTLTNNEINLITLYRDATNIATGGSGTVSDEDSFGMSHHNDTSQQGSGQSFSVLDSPSTTSSVAYTPKFGSFNGNTVYVQIWGQTSTITLMEITG